ncbi:MFS transporter [Candidatus Legionella polyplacis]|uniref:MFS transporter n=1 Tax=Candidatus Legionella polyplacis TaxID=2005262 RepID=A0ABZ2H031_9GAMM
MIFKRSFFSDSNKYFMSWLVCLSSGLFFCYEFFQFNIFDVINESLRSDFKINSAQLSWMSSMYLWADVFFLIPAGIILDCFSVRKVVLITMLICIFGIFGFAISHSFIFASIFYFISGIGNAFCFLSCVVLISRWFPSCRRALIIGIVIMMAFIGGMISHILLTWLNNFFNWRFSLYIDVVTGLFLFLWLYLVIQDFPYLSYPNKDKNILSMDKYRLFICFLNVIKNKQNWLIGLYTSLLNLPVVVLCALWGGTYLQYTYHLSKLESVKIINMIFMGSIFGSPLMGWISDFYKRRKPLMFFGAIMNIIVMIPLCIKCLFISKFLLFILFFLIGFFASSQVISCPLISESNSSLNTGAATSIASIIIMGGGAIGQVLFGYLVQIHSNYYIKYYLNYDFIYAMRIFPISLIIALFTVFFIKETYCRSLVD